MAAADDGTAGVATTGWGEHTRFSAIGADAEAALAAQRVGSRKHLMVLGSARADSASAGHACPGEIFADIYVAEDGSVHVAVSVWYQCDSHLEIVGDVTIP